MNPLMYAIQWGHYKMANVLLEHPFINLSNTNKLGRNMIHLMMMIKTEIQYELLYKIIYHPTCTTDVINKQDISGITPLMLAASVGTNNLRVLLSRDDINCSIRDINKWTALHYALYYDQEQFVQFILQHKSIKIDLNQVKEYFCLLILI